jgi:succinate-acetate transporter protein
MADHPDQGAVASGPGGRLTGTPAEQQTWAERDARLEAMTRIVLRPIGSPGALGLLGLGAATWVLAGLQVGWVDAAEGKNVAIVALGFAFVAQLLASIFSFLARDTVMATAMGQLALIWLVIGLVTYTSPPGAKSDALGLFLLFVSVSMLLTAATAALSKLVPALVFATAALRFALGGLDNLTGNVTWENLAGVVGLVLTCLALYAAWAIELEDALGSALLPLGRRAKGKEAAEGPLLEQVREVANKAGVKKQL